MALTQNFNESSLDYWHKNLQKLVKNYPVPILQSLLCYIKILDHKYNQISPDVTWGDRQQKGIDKTPLDNDVWLFLQETGGVVLTAEKKKNLCIWITDLRKHMIFYTSMEY